MRAPRKARAGQRVLGRFAGEGHRRGGGQTIGGNRVVAAMAVAAAALALLLHVGQFTAGRHFAIAADDAAACEGGEAEKANETHSAESRSKLCTAEQYLLRDRTSTNSSPIRDRASDP